MKAGDALRPVAAGGNRRDRERGGVGGENAIGGDDLLQFPEKRALDLQVLPQSASTMSEHAARSRRSPAMLMRSGALRASSGAMRPFSASLPIMAIACSRGGPGLLGGNVVGHYEAARLSQDLDDSASHDTRADDADPVKFRLVHDCLQCSGSRCRLRRAASAVLCQAGEDGIDGRDEKPVAHQGQRSLVIGAVAARHRILRHHRVVIVMRTRADSGFDAAFRVGSEKHRRIDAVGAQDQIEIGAVKGVGAQFLDDRIMCARLDSLAEKPPPRILQGCNPGSSRRGP